MLSLHQMYEAMGLLQKHNTRVEEAIFFRTASLMEMEVDLVSYDTTTISFSIDIADEAEEIGSDSVVWSTQGRQLVVALAVTRRRLPVCSWVFPGNTTDVTTVAKVKRDLKG